MWYCSVAAIGGSNDAREWRLVQSEFGGSNSFWFQFGIARERMWE